MRRLSGCLYTLPTFQRRVLVLRTGVGGADPTPRRRVARRLGANTETVGRAESRGLAALKRTADNGGCGGSTGPVNMNDFPSFLPLASSAPMLPPPNQFASVSQAATSLPSADPVDPDYDPSPSGGAGSVLGSSQSGKSGDGYSSLDSRLQSDGEPPISEDSTRTAAATSDGGFLPLPVILMVMLLLAAGAAYAILGRTRRRTADVPAHTPDVALATATAAPVVAPPTAPERPMVPEPEPEPEPESKAEPAAWLGGNAFADPEPATERSAEPTIDEAPQASAEPTPDGEAPAGPAPAAPAAAAAPLGRRRQGGLVGKVTNSGPIRRALNSRRRDS